MNSDRLALAAGAVLGATGVALGAFGAHALTDVLDERALSVWDTAVRYHLLHAVVLTALGLSAADSAWRGRAAVLFGAGVVLFSGSLYALALGGPRWLGPVTPLGGVALITAWIMLAWSVWERP